MKGKKIYVLHEYGAESHYNALAELCKKEGIVIKYRIFNFRIICSKIIHGEIINGLANIWFLISIPFRKATKIVLGIAPFNHLLPFLMFLLKRHKVYYHTSYTCWDGTTCALSTKSKKLKKYWKLFVRCYVKHIFAVSNKTKEELVSNGYANYDKISVVNHSYKQSIPIMKRKKNNTFIFVGRLIESKGIKELLNIFASRPNANLIIAGDGQLRTLIERYENQYHNIKYLGFVSGLDNLIPLYKKASFVIMNSQRTSTWEELFGIAIIEGMACGCVPITTDHTGPKEIITIEENGLIYEEGKISDGIDKAIAMTDLEYSNMQYNAIFTGQSYHSSIMANKWQQILNI